MFVQLPSLTFPAEKTASVPATREQVRWAGRLALRQLQGGPFFPTTLEAPGEHRTPFHLSPWVSQADNSCLRTTEACLLCHLFLCAAAFSTPLALGRCVTGWSSCIPVTCLRGSLAFPLCPAFLLHLCPIISYRFFFLSIFISPDHLADFTGKHFPFTSGF